MIIECPNCNGTGHSPIYLGPDRPQAFGCTECDGYGTVEIEEPNVEDIDATWFC